MNKCSPLITNIRLIIVRCLCATSTCYFYDESSCVLPISLVRSCGARGDGHDYRRTIACRWSGPVRKVTSRDLSHVAGSCEGDNGCLVCTGFRLRLRRLADEIPWASSI